MSGKMTTTILQRRYNSKDSGEQQGKQANNRTPHPLSLSSLSTHSSSLATVGCTKEYASKRTMTPFQEKINAITILPFFCFYYILNEQWLLDASIQQAKLAVATLSPEEQSGYYYEMGCLDIPGFPNLHYSPPPTILAIAIGIMVHCPCSFLYHWKYAIIPNPVERIQHWSRRLDHCAIHACSAFWSYGVSSGNTPFVLFNVLYNADSIRCHLQPEINPRRNQRRILGSMFLYTSPLLWMLDDNFDSTARRLLFGKIWVLFIVAVWLFVAYPLRGWSHAAFHMIMVSVPLLLCDMVAKVEADGDWSMAAAQCAVIKTSMSAFGSSWRVFNIQ